MTRASRGGSTLEEVAALAGVSRQTVSNVLNAPSRVAPRTKERVESAIRELNYRPNRVARSLRTRASRLLGYCVKSAVLDSLNPVLDRFIHAITASAAAKGYYVLLFTAPDGEDGLPVYAELLAQGAVDGFVLSDTVVGDPRHSWLKAQEVPFVSFGKTWSDEEPGPWVDVDGATGVRRAVEHVHELGHRRIAFIGWPEGSGSGDDRLSGYLTACDDLGIERQVARDEGDVGTAKRLAGSLLDDADPPTALICVSDLVAHGALLALTERDLRPGHDVALTGFDDSPSAALPGVDLTSVNQPIEEVGQSVVRMLLDTLDPEDVPAAAGVHLLLEPTLTIRSSTRPERALEDPS